MMNNEKEKDAILPKYDPLKLNSINLAQNYVSAFNTGMNIYQCVNQLQGYIEWVVKAVNDVVKSWNVQVGESIDQSKAIVRETTTEQFNTEWTNKQPELIEQVNTLTTNQFNEDWGILENRINTTLENQNTNIQNIQNEQNELETNTNNNINAQNTKINSIQTQQTNLANEQNTKINSIQTQQTNLANEQTTLSNRMDTFTSLSAGSTTGDAELQDIRVGANGVTYNNAGDAVRGQYKQLKDKIVYLETNVTVTDGERGHRTNAVLDMSQPIYVSITPTTTNTFNAFITHGETEVQFLTALDITGGETYTFVFDREIIDNVAKDYGINAFDDKWRVNIRNTTNSKNYKYSIFTKENEKVLHDKKVYVSTTKDAGTFSLVSYACNYLKAKFNNVPCTVFVRNGVYEEKPTNEFPYAPINIANTMINIIGESVDGVIINLTNSSQKQSRIMHIGGFQTIANMTLNVLADATYRGNTGNNPYVIHNDATYSNFTGHYSTTVENCKLYSECSPPIGGGLHGNQTQIYRNVVFIYNSEYDTGGCLYVHGASNEGQIPDGLIIDGCTAISKNGTVALTLPSVSGYTPYTETPVTIRRTILATNGATEVDSDFKTTHNLTSDSKLNSNEYINY